MVGRSRTEEIVLLRDFGYGWRQIARMVYGCGCDKCALKAYSLYAKKLERARARAAAAAPAAAGEEDTVALGAEWYVKSKLYAFQTLYERLREEREHLARLAKYAGPGERPGVLERLHRVKLLQLIMLLYNMTGLASEDRSRLYAMRLLQRAKALVGRADASKDHVRYGRGSVQYASAEASAFALAVFISTLAGSKYSKYIYMARDILLPRDPKRASQVLKALQEKYWDVLVEAGLGVKLPLGV